MSNPIKKDAFAELADKHTPKKKSEDRDAWDDYVDSFNHQQKMEKDLGPEIHKRGPDLALLSGQGATFGHLDELQGAGAEMMGGDYREARDQAREKIAGARERQGLWGDAAEMGGSMVTSLAVPLLRGGTAVREIGLAALQGAGEAPELEDIPKSAGKSALISAGTQAITGRIKNVAFGEPEDILANTAGARGIDRRKSKVLPSMRGNQTSKDPADIAGRLDKIGFFKPGDRVFDPHSKTFVLNNYPAGKLEGYIKPQGLDDFLKRTEMVTSTLGQQNTALLKGKNIPLKEVDDVLIDTAIDFIPEGAGVEKRIHAAQDLVQEIVSDLRSRGAIKGNVIAAEEVQKIKQFLQEKVAKSYENQAISDITNDALEARRTYATKLDDLLDKHGGPEYKANNELMRDVYAQRKSIFDKDSRRRGESISGAKLVRPTPMDHIYDTIDNPTVGYGRAKVGQFLETPAGVASGNALNRIPQEVIMNRGNDRGRTPQSEPNLPEELIRTPLPRTTEGLMKNKSFVLAKIAQMAPEMLETVKDVYENDPEMLDKLAPVIAQKMPHFFQRDKYNRFDGRIMTEADKARAIKDTLGDARLSTIEQAKIITRLNKEGLYDR